MSIFLLSAVLRVKRQSCCFACVAMLSQPRLYQSSSGWQRSAQVRLLYKCLLVCLLLGVTTSVRSQEWVPQLEKSKNTEFHEPMETFSIYIPFEVSQTVLQTLVLELDNIDVTAMIRRNGEFFEFTPVQSLGWGEHVLRLVEYAEDGNIIEKGYWQIRVRKSSIFREVDYAGDIHLRATQLLDDNIQLESGEEEPAGFSAQGSGAFEGRVASDSWQVGGSIELFYNSEVPEGDRVLEMGEYLISGDIASSQTQFNVGHHALTQSSLIMQDFNRRGVSASTNLSLLNSTVTGFSLRAEQLLGFNNGFGVSDSENRVSGLLWEIRPLKNKAQQLYISATYLSGDKNAAGESVGEVESSQQGDAIGLVVDSTILQQQLRLRAEVASSIVDIITADPTDNDLIDEQDTAYSLLIQYSPQAPEDEGELLWSSGFEFNKINTYFSSLANPGLPSDKKLNRIFFNADWNGLSTQLSSAKETDNVNNLDSRPQIETRLNQLTVNYSLTDIPEQGSLFDNIGSPVFGLQLSNSNQRQIKNNFDDLGNPLFAELDLSNDMLMLSASFSKGVLSWGVSISQSEQTDEIFPLNSQRTRAQGLDVNWQLNQSIIISPSIQLQTTDLEFDNSRSDTNIYNLNLQWYLARAINGSVAFNRTETESNSTGFDQEAVLHNVGLQFSWNWILPKNNKPGFDVSFSGNYQNTDDSVNALNNSDTYQLYLSLDMKLPFSSME